jgi:D-beta-D-heptose 7-phosphate kinase/D-beta-D-heptose 1-phosphate adenosyltransferase
MNGLKIVINGCFDLLHAGHINLIETALRNSFEGKILILVNSDSSVRELKGEGRPIQEVLIRGNNVDQVCKAWCLKNREHPKVSIVIFNSESELEEKIDSFAPHMIIKGDDRYDLRDIVGSGKWPILIIPRIKDKNNQEYSTTREVKERRR